MEKIEAPKKERKFLKAIGNIGKLLAQELVMGIGRKFIGGIVDKIKLPKKRQGLIILLLLSCGMAFAQYPATGNKQRLGFQTTADGLLWRGSLSDTASIQPTSNQNAWVILDTVNLKFYSFDFTSNVWNQLPSGSTIDTTSLSNRIDLRVKYADTTDMLLPYLRKADTSLLNLQSRLDLKLNIADTSGMLSNYATKAYADTTGRFYARQDFTNVSSSTLTWTQSDTLVTGGVNVVQVYRNGQILLPSQYTIPSSTSVVISATSYKAGENYTVIFPRGGGAGSGGGSGSLTSISAGTGITVSPNPITTTGTVSADLSVLMELTDTVSLSNRINLKLNATDTASLSNRINAKGTGTVTSVASGYGLLSTQSPITTSGVIRVDSNTVYNYVRDSIVKVRIGNDTIKILKQEYNNVTTDTLTWTTTNKFPIQLRAFILLFRNGQLLINDQYSVIDTNKIKVAATSYKVGENYTLVTVSGNGSAGVSQTGNPIYPEAGIALSTGTTWTTSIPNNSSNWNTAFTDRLKWDGGSTGLVAATGRTSLGGTTIGQSMFTLSNPSTISFPRFNADNTITSRSAANFRNDIGAGTVTSVNVAAGTPLSIQNNTTIPEISMAAATGSVNGYLTSTDWTTFNNKENTITAGTTGQYFRGDKTFQTLDKNAVGLGNVDNTSDANKPVSTATQTALNLKVNISDTASMLTPYFRDADTTQLNLTSRFNTKQNTLSGTGFVKANGTTISYDNSTYLTTGTAASTYLPLTGGTLTGGLTGTTGTFTGINVNNSSESILGLQPGDNNLASKIQFKHFGTIRQEIIKPNSTSNLQFRSYPTGTATGGYEFYVSNGSLESLAATIGTDKSLAVTGNITEAGNNVLTNLDTASLSSRIDSKFNSSGGTISGKAILNDSVRFEGNILFKKNMGLPIVKISNADYTATTSNHTIIYTVLTADKTLTIPNASDAIGIKYIISIFDIPEGNEALTLVTPSSNLFVRTDGESSNVDIVGGYCTTIQSDGIKWYILSYAPMY